ncbi:hypothetical protein [Nocardiopsis sp. MG754419]|uniref:hypothetical protein n=1 Tax=Nocardiopsis sp. MG754419 TaxID=2259865 RepID=UPI001BAC1911|nr:hypothetical protein [Nocardiopsis sp. MG754419]MBR8742227.1 hypothetical protein [Nocardiopsis sp. MG754419]
MTADLEQAWRALESGDVGHAVDALRTGADDLPAADLARFVGALGRSADLPELTTAAQELREHPDDPATCFDFGHVCLEAGLPHLAVPALRTARDRAPDAVPVLWELISALEDLERHADAVRALRAWSGELPDWPGGYLLAYNTLCSGDIDAARRILTDLPTPEDESWDLAHDRVTRMVERAEAAREAGPMDGDDLRGWHFALTGAVLGRIPRHDPDTTTNGRYAHLEDDLRSRRTGIADLAAILSAAGRSPDAVMPLPDRSSRVLGLAAARLLDLPVVPVDPERSDALVVAYDLGDADTELRRSLVPRSPGQVLFEHASCWSDPPGVAADVVSVLHRTVTPPWGAVPAVDDDVVREPGDAPPEEEVAERIVAMTPGHGDPGAGPFTKVVADRWADGPRLPSTTSGPVHDAGPARPEDRRA